VRDGLALLEGEWAGERRLGGRRDRVSLVTQLGQAPRERGAGWIRLQLCERGV
jgi:hypothetical protein